jgi:hypothetical protein
MRPSTSAVKKPLGKAARAGSYFFSTAAMVIL